MKLFLALLVLMATSAIAETAHLEIAPTAGLSGSATFQLTEVSDMGTPVRFLHRVVDADVSGEMQLAINGNIVPNPLGETGVAAGTRIPGRVDNAEDWIELSIDRAFFNYAGANTVQYSPLRGGSSYNVTGIVVEYTYTRASAFIPCSWPGLEALSYDDPRCVDPSPPSIALPMPSQYTLLAEKLKGSQWQLPDCWPTALALGDWRAKIRSYSTPDRWYAGLWCRDTGRRYGFSGEWAEVQRYIAQERDVDPATPLAPFTACETAFLWSTDNDAIVKACSYAYTSSTTATTVPVYTSTTSSTRVGTVPKGAPCDTWDLVGPAASAQQYWFRVTATDTGAPGFARCRNTGY